MTAVYVNQTVSFPSLPKKKALVGVKSFPQFSKNLKQVRYFTGQKWEITCMPSPLKGYYVISKFFIDFKMSHLPTRFFLPYNFKLVFTR